MRRFTGRAVVEKGERDEWSWLNMGDFTTVFLLVEGINVVTLVPKQKIK